MKTPKVTNNETGQIDLNKRATVLGAAGGLTALSAWHTPIINSVLTPAHAQTSQVISMRQFFGANLTPMAATGKTLSPFDLIVPVAHAQSEEMDSYTISVEEDGDDFMIDLLISSSEPGFDVAEILYNGVINGSSGGSLAVSDNPCDLMTGPIAATIDSVSDTEVVVNLTGTGETLTALAGTGVVPIPMCQETPIPSYFVGDEMLRSEIFTVLATAVDSSADSFSIEVLRSNVDGSEGIELNYTGTLDSSGAFGNLSLVAPCVEALDNIESTITSVDSMELVLVLASLELEITLPSGTGMVPGAVCSVR